MKQMITVLAILISGIALAQTNEYEYDLIRFDQHRSDATNQGFAWAGLSIPNDRWARSTDDLRGDQFRLELNNGNTVRYKMTDEFALYVTNDLVDSRVNGQGPTINRFGPFNYNYVELHNAGTRTFRVELNRLPRRWRIDLQYQDRGETRWYTSSARPRWFSLIPTSTYELRGRSLTEHWTSSRVVGTRILVYDQNRVLRQITRTIRWD